MKNELNNRVVSGKRRPSSLKHRNSQCPDSWPEHASSVKYLLAVHTGLLPLVFVLQPHRRRLPREMSTADVLVCSFTETGRDAAEKKGEGALQFVDVCISIILFADWGGGGFREGALQT